MTTPTYAPINGLTPFECSFVLRRKVQTWIRYGLTRDEAREAFLRILETEHPEACAIAVVPAPLEG